MFKLLRPGYVALAVDKATIKATIFEHPEFKAFITGMNDHFAAWRDDNAKKLKALKARCHPNTVIFDLSEDLLAHYAGKPLVNRYDVYQHLLDYWASTMQDDCYLIAADGWKAETYRIVERDKKGKDKDKGWTCDLIPKPLIIRRFFAHNQAVIDKLTQDLETVTASLEELEQEQEGEEGAFADFEKINKATVAARLKEIRGDKDAADEIEALGNWLEFSAQQTDLKKLLKDAEEALDTKVYKQYPKLTEAEIKALVVEDKWLAALDADIHGEMDRISQGLAQRVRTFAERYETPAPELASRVSKLEAKVKDHLERMGFSW